MMSEERKEYLIAVIKKHVGAALHHVHRIEIPVSEHRDSNAEIGECIAVAFGEIVGRLKGQLEIAGFHEEEINILLYDAELRGYSKFQQENYDPAVGPNTDNVTHFF
jgi:hypothetical protein